MSSPSQSVKSPLKFKVAPHIVEDLGLNLYTSLSRVFVEFVANAYDADSSDVKISLDKDGIKKARKEMKEQYEKEKRDKEVSGETLEPLATRTLPENLKIVIEDTGHGMSRDDLDSKFLVAGRRRRQEEPETKGRSPKGRPLMGRKGIGKLAGFGVAQVIEVVTRKSGEPYASRIVLDYKQLVKKRDAHEIEVPDERLDDGGDFSKSGTRVVLSRLFYDPLKSRPETIEQEIGEHFMFVQSSEFAIELNGEPIQAPSRTHAYAWPEPEKVAVNKLVSRSVPREGGGEIVFKYRIRFTGKKQALPAAKRGVRVYAQKRLAATPSLLGADTNMHGFRMTDYLDGVVEADFIDKEEADYIATDRQSLRWESPLLSGMYDFLGKEIKEACKQYQRKRDEEAKKVVEEDQFTNEEIEKYDFSKKDKRLAVQIAALLEGASKQGVDDPGYKNKLPILVRSVGHGSILTAISALAEEGKPELHRVAVEVAKLTKDELDQFITVVKARIKAIGTLRRIVDDVDFKKQDNEKTMQTLFEKCPWIIDPTYSQFLTADQTVDTLVKRLAKYLKTGEYAAKDGKAKNDRPDLVFLLGNKGLNKLVIVELKSANLSLEESHRGQLVFYMEQASEWLSTCGHDGMKIHGQLIGSMPLPDSKAQGAVTLRAEIRKAGPTTDWTVRDLMQVLEDTEAAHDELLRIHHAVEDAAGKPKDVA